MKDKNVELAGIKIGNNYPVAIAAEIGTYFGTDLGLAKEYIIFAKEVGVEFLKTEILHDLSIIHDASMTHTYNTYNGPKTENYLKLLARKRLSLEDYEKLFRFAKESRLPVIASVYDIKGVDFLVAMQAAAVKIASQNITHRPLIEHCAKSGLPLIIDTGNAFFHEIAEAVQWAETGGVRGLILNHRPDGSPCPANEQNMRILRSIADTFGWPVGFSCHYDGDEMIYLAIGMGARLIEKPLYHKQIRDDQDTMFVLYYDDFREMVRKVRNCSVALGENFRRKQSASQLECRVCLVASKDIQKGTPLSLDNATFAWPMRGIPASNWNDVVGMVAVRDLKKGETIKWTDIGTQAR